MSVRFEGEDFNDERLFLLLVARCRVGPVVGDPGLVDTTIYHSDVPEDAGWCIVFYRNVPRYPLWNVMHFNDEQAAIEHLQGLEPKVPRIDLGGQSPSEPLDWEPWCEYKHQKGWQEYDYRNVFTVVPGGMNYNENIITKKPI